MTALLKYLWTISFIFSISQCSADEKRNRKTLPDASKQTDASDPGLTKEDSQALEQIDTKISDLTPEQLGEYTAAEGQEASSKPISDGNANHDSYASAGGIVDGNSGEFITYQHNPWFMTDGENPQASFTYCLGTPTEDEFAAQYSIKIADARELIKIAMLNWDDALTKARIALNPTLEDQKELNNKIDAAHFVDKRSRRIVSTSVEVECHNNPDVTFLFGPSTNPELAKIPNVDAKIALAIRKSYDPQNTWSKGSIWISPDNSGESGLLREVVWSDFWRFHAVILHELGHVFGLPHGSIEIMKDSFPLEVISNPAKSFNHLQEFKFTYKNQPLISVRSFFRQSWLYDSHSIERFTSAPYTALISPAEINALETLSKKRLLLGFPKLDGSGSEPGSTNPLLINAYNLLSLKNQVSFSVFGKHNFMQSNSSYVQFSFGTSSGYSIGFGYYGIINGFSFNKSYERLHYKALTTSGTWESHPSWLLVLPPKDDSYTANLLISSNVSMAQARKYSVILEKKSYGKDLEIRVFNDNEMYLSFYSKAISDNEN